MTRRNSGPSIDVPEPIADELAALDDDSLREVISYTQSLLNERLAPTSQIEEGPNEEIVSIQEQDGYTLAMKKHFCASDCGDCPHGPYLYRVRAERSPVNGKSSLHWSFLGRIKDAEPSR